MATSRTRDTERVVEALNLQHAKTVVKPVGRESERMHGESIRECSWESMRALDSKSEKASMHDVLGADTTSLHRSAVARLNYWAVDRLDMQYLVRVCSKSMSNPRVNDWRRLKRVASYVKGCPDTGSMFEWQTAPSRLSVHSDSDWAGANGILGRQGLGKLRHLVLSHLWLSQLCEESRSTLRKCSQRATRQILERRRSRG